MTAKVFPTKYYLDLDVTPEDIERGVRFKSRACPIALAAARATGLEAVVKYGILTLYNQDGATAVYPLTQKATTFVFAFDVLRTAQPVKLRLRLERSSWR